MRVSLAAIPVAAQTTNDPFDAPIPAEDGVITVRFTEYASLPDVDGTPARAMHLVGEPDGDRVFVIDMHGLLYVVGPEGDVSEYLDLKSPTWGLEIQASSRERGLQSFA